MNIVPMILLSLAVIVPIAITVLIVCYLISRNKRKKESAERRCPQCGIIVSNDDSFCTKCGTQLE